MAQLNSFDITSTVDLQEVDNALNQARKEIGQRYDFKGARAEIDFSRAENTITIVADDNFKMEAIWEIVQRPAHPSQRAGEELQARRHRACRGGGTCAK